MSVDPYSEWDAAYVLGSLSASERHEYEEHLVGCPGCRAALADLAGMPALLAHIDPEAAFALLDEPGVQPAAAQQAPDAAPAPLEPLLARARRHRARTRLLAAVAGVGALAAAVAVTLVVVFAAAPAGPGLTPAAASSPLPVATPSPAATSTGTGPAHVVQFVAEVPSPLTAVATFDDEPWGTRIAWECTYGGEAGGAAGAGAGSGAGYGETHGYAMIVTDRAGVSTQVATWSAGPGSVAEPVATTSIRRADIASATIVATDSGQVLLRAVQ